jgi:predicted MFS family arabinose efflux permease
MTHTKASVLNALAQLAKFLLLFSIMMGFAHFLLIAKTEQMLKKTVQGVVQAQLDPLLEQMQSAYRLGIYPESFLSAEKIQALKERSPRIVAIDWRNSEAQQQNKHEQVAPSVLNIPVINSFGVEIAYFDVAYTVPELKGLRNTLHTRAMQLAPWLFLIAVAASLICTKWFSKHANWVICALGTLAMLTLAYPMFKTIEHQITPLIQERIRSIATAQQNLWNTAFEQGFGHRDFADLQTSLKELTEKHIELGAATLMKKPDTVGSDSVWIELDLGHAIELTPNPEFLEQLSGELMLDYLTLALIVFFFWMQFRKPAKPMPGEILVDTSGIHHRWPVALFVYFLSEELIRPILPGMATALPGDWFNPDTSGAWMGGLSISVFMLLVALAPPFLNHINTPTKAVRGFTIGCTLGTLGQLFTLWSPSAEWLLLARSVAGIGYACAFVSGQTMLLIAHGAAGRATAFASLVGAIMAATIVGPAFGGLLADNLGEQFTFMLAAVVPVAALLIGRGAPFTSPKMADHNSSEVTTKKPSPFAGMNSPRLLLLSLLAAAPAKMLLTGLLFFLVPWMAFEAPEMTASTTGRILLVYGLLMFLLTPRVADYLQRGGLEINRAAKFVSLGLLVSASAGFLPLINLLGQAPLFSQTLIAFGIAVALGFGQALSISAQGSLVQLYQKTYAPDQPNFAWLGSYRLLERTGNALGPLLAALCLQFMESNQLVFIFSATALALGVLCWFALQARQQGETA